MGRCSDPDRSSIPQFILPYLLSGSHPEKYALSSLADSRTTDNLRIEIYFWTFNVHECSEIGVRAERKNEPVVPISRVDPIAILSVPIDLVRRLVSVTAKKVCNCGTDSHRVADQFPNVCLTA